MDEETQTGVEDVPAAGGQETAPAEVATGETSPGPAAGDADGRVEQAFAKRFAAERAKMEPDLRLAQRFRELGYNTDQVMAAMEGRFQKPTQANYEEQLADQLGITAEAAKTMMQMGMGLQQMQAQLSSITEESSLRLLKEKDPAFDRTKAEEVRNSFREKYGVDLAWEDAWDMASRDIQKHRAEQAALAGMTAKDKAKTSPPSGDAPGKVDINTLSSKEFNSLVERVKRGEKIQL